MMILGGAGILLNPTIKTDANALNNTTVFASSSVEVFKYQALDLNIGLLIAFFSLLATLFAATAAYLSYRTARDTFTNDILMKFFEISSWLPKQGKQLSPHQKQYVCNYLDFVCYWLERKKISKRDIEPLYSVMKTPIFVNFAARYRRQHGKLFFDCYWRWLKANP